MIGVNGNHERIDGHTSNTVVKSTTPPARRRRRRRRRRRATTTTTTATAAAQRRRRRRRRWRARGRWETGRHATSHRRRWVESLWRGSWGHQAAREGVEAPERLGWEGKQRERGMPLGGEYTPRRVRGVKRRWGGDHDVGVGVASLPRAWSWSRLFASSEIQTGSDTGATLDAVKFLDSQTSFRRRRSIVSRFGTFILQVLRRLSLFLRLRIDSWNLNKDGW